MRPIEPFERLSAAGKVLLAGGVSEQHLAKGQRAIERGQKVAGAYFVIEGRLRVFADQPDGRASTLYELKRGETCVLALNSLFNDLAYPASVEAIEDSRVAIVSGPAYRALFASEASIQELTVRALSTIVFRLMSELEQVHGSRLEQRLARLILGQAMRNGATSDGAADGEVRKTQQELAHQLGTTREVVARLMAQFAAQGVVRTQRGRIAILDEKALARIGAAHGA